MDRMPFLDRLAGIFASTVTKADPPAEPVTLTDPLASFLFGALPTLSDMSVRPKSAMTVPAVASAVELIAEAVGTLPVKLFVRNAEGRAADAKHPAFRLAHDEANDWTSAAELRTQLTHYALLNDKGGFALANRVNGGVVEFIRRIAKSSKRAATAASATPLSFAVRSPDVCCSMAITVFKWDMDVKTVLDLAMGITHFGGRGRPSPATL